MAARDGVRDRRSRLILFSTLVLMSLVGGFLLEVVLGAWVHHRYWNVSSAKINQNRADLVVAFMEEPALRDRVRQSPEDPPAALSLIVRHVAVRLERNGDILWELKHDRRSIKDELARKSLGGGLTLKVLGYTPLSWRANLGSWIVRPNKWFSDRFNFITVPFLFLSALVFVFLLSLVWRHRARYVEREVKSLIEDVDAVR